ncbi:hypothetical protein [Vitiosangium sp. GDMCC 1.1324]|uniref:hypothetical protein n=1 Tax=Vitiosangium sp. (strain GDMCC 1.1324) TaxID=2138576 RepID=UPI0018EE9197|nr:hypothetical protein [Vitiosangium sp. GDMCC 1.1324]
MSPSPFRRFSEVLDDTPLLRGVGELMLRHEDTVLVGECRWPSVGGRWAAESLVVLGLLVGAGALAALVLGTGQGASAAVAVGVTHG